MISWENIFNLLLVILPVVLYTFIFHSIFPKEIGITVHSTIKFWLYGILSAIGVFVLNYIVVFPDWRVIFPNISPLGILIIYNFFQVAFIEEISKFALIKFGKPELKSPILFFFTAAMVSVGFSIAENYVYLINFGSNVLPIRAITATVIHFTLGIIMSYFMTLAKIKQNSLLILTSLIVATLIHGAYDFNLSIDSEYSGKISCLIIISCIIISQKMTNHIIELTEK